MSQQLDEAGGALLHRMVSGLGISVHLDVGTDSIERLGEDALRVALGDGTHVDWVSSYTHPARSGGRPLETVSSRLLLWNFGAILARCAKDLAKRPG